MWRGVGIPIPMRMTWDVQQQRQQQQAMANLQMGNGFANGLNQQALEANQLQQLMGNQSCAQLGSGMQQQRPNQLQQMIQMGSADILNATVAGRGNDTDRNGSGVPPNAANGRLPLPGASLDGVTGIDGGAASSSLDALLGLLQNGGGAQPLTMGTSVLDAMLRTTAANGSSLQGPSSVLPPVPPLNGLLPMAAQRSSSSR